MILYLDCASGVSGDMLVGALLSLAGAREDHPGPLDDLLRPALASAGIDPRLVQIEDVRRGGLAALAFKVADQPGFATFDELIMSLYASDLEAPVADAVASIAERMAAAEAEVHGRDEGEEHLHELSDVDTAVDLICAVTLMAKLAPERVVASPPALGDGEVETAHGRLSVPAPAVLGLLAGLPTAGGAPVVAAGETPAAPLGELTTPTGAALLAHFADEFGGLPRGRVERVGYGAGRREVPGRPNVLRAVLVDPEAVPEEPANGTPVATAPGAIAATHGGHGPGDHVVLEANIDDMTPELLAHAADALREAGALDVWMSQAFMKKGRPGVVLHVLAPAAEQDDLADVVFAETTTFGVRVVPCDRLYAEERRESVKIGKLKVGVRLSFVGGRLASVSPEYEDVRRVAAAVGRPARIVYEAAQSAARSRFSGS
ncbi:MAG: nickel pincer cofactor biosynthesis protein LarC [Actinobacteria bacterium]|nr:nickel pincer cofactor biosynthesis protein LarC [Actinomycetota bacterium]